jgi:hypothetical protein
VHCPSEGDGRPVRAVGVNFRSVLRLFSLLSAAIGAANSESSDALLGLLFGFGSVIFMPLFYGILGFVFGLIAALLYNGVARLIGGVEIEEISRSGSVPGSTVSP